MSPAAATATATATTAGADGAALKGGSAKGKAQRDAGKGRLLEMRLGTWNVQALGWGLLQMLLGMSCLDADGAEWRRQRAIPAASARHPSRCSLNKLFNIYQNNIYYS